MSEAALPESPTNTGRSVPWIPGLAKQPTDPAELAAVLERAIRACTPRSDYTVVGEGRDLMLVHGWTLYLRCRQLILRWWKADPRLPVPPGYPDAQAGVGNALMNQLQWCEQASAAREARGASEEEHIAAGRQSGETTGGTISTIEPLPPALQEVWELLDGRALTAKELGNLVAGRPINEWAMRQRLRRLCRRGYVVENVRGRGYYRPDAPPVNRDTA